jgi:DNA repair protein RecO
MYSITNTEGIILKSFDQGESDVLVSVLTKDLGHIYAKATGVRSIKSKNRFALQEHSHSHISLIQGKTGWKITNTSPLKSLYFEPTHSFQREAILKILAIVKRLFIGEDSHPKVFTDLTNSLDQITICDTKEGVDKISASTLFNFLNDLGYIEDGEDCNLDNLPKLREIINKGIVESGL